MLGDLQNMIPHLAVLAAIVLTIVSLALYRTSIAQKQDFHLHYEGAEKKDVGEQLSVATRLLAIDRWGKILTVVAVVYAVGLVGLLVYQQWLRSSTTIMTN